jgi:hypothetical protein
MIRWGVSPAWAKEENEQVTMSVKHKRIFFISFTLDTIQNKKSPRLRREDCTLFHFIPNRYPEMSPDFSGTPLPPREGISFIVIGSLPMVYEAENL